MGGYPPGADVSDKTKISWCDATWNPTTGCNRVSAGCAHCYAAREWLRLSAIPGSVYFGRSFFKVACHPERLDQPARWRRPRRIFVDSMSDLFHVDVPDVFIARVFAAIAAAPHHTFLLLTKRPERMRDWIADYAQTVDSFGHVFSLTFEGAFSHLWLGVSAEDQATADARIPVLLQTRAALRWVSAEPLLGAIALEHWCGDLPEDADGAPYLGGLDWVVAGGESGPRARRCYPAWVRSLREQCVTTGTPFHFKQWGEYGVSRGRTMETLIRCGKRLAGRLLDGEMHDAFPRARGEQS